MDRAPLRQNQDRRDYRPLIVGPVLLAAALYGATLIKPKPAPSAETPKPAAAASEPVLHRAIPDEVRGIYLTASTASMPSRWSEIVSEAGKRGVNALVVDLKGDRGALAFVPRSPALKAEAPAKPLIRDLDRLIADAHAAGFYLIARIPFFEDPAYVAAHREVGLKRADGSLWQDKNGLYWADPAAEQVWRYNAALAEEAYARGFDEIQFDYIRFATDGNTKSIVFPHYDPKKESYRGTIGRLFAYLDSELRPQGITISADLFGLAAWHQSDLGIGQWYDDAILHFDFVSPMAYPSHYAAGTLGFRNPAEHPYEVVADTLKKGGEAIAAARAADPSAKLARQRPWLQAFNLGAIYTPAMVMSQVRASRESGDGFLYWNAANNYGSLPDLSASRGDAAPSH